MATPPAGGRPTRFVVRMIMRIQLAVAITFIAAVAPPAASRAAAQPSYFGATCAADGGGCATASAVPVGGQYVWDASVTFNRVGLISFRTEVILSPTGHVPGSEDLNEYKCCYAPATSVAVFPVGAFLTPVPWSLEAYYRVPVGLWTVAPGDTRTAAQLQADIFALYPADGPPPEVLEQAGLHRSLAYVTVTATPEPSTFGLLGAGALLVAVVARRRSRRV